MSTEWVLLIRITHWCGYFVSIFSKLNRVTVYVMKPILCRTYLRWRSRWFSVCPSLWRIRPPGMNSFRSCNKKKWDTEYKIRNVGCEMWWIDCNRDRQQRWVKNCTIFLLFCFVTLFVDNSNAVGSLIEIENATLRGNAIIFRCIALHEVG